ncbi:hypothetical protein [Ligilactobacillus saerimneri]|uniref:hypothetical protein n=1 Tax=Ligilactobacillus saerimneri TaxID=228229 RepID=UPI0024B04946|nr:hypothetical protein [Ligilactobacillus saerimneri]MDI9206671.1 hypothetical protein [Ligilactobacillus saerimneri]
MTIEEEAALAYIKVNQNEEKKDFEKLDLEVAYESLKKQEMIRRTSKNKIGYEYSLTRKGAKYYKEIRTVRGEKEAISDEADALMLCLAVEDERNNYAPRILSRDLAADEYYGELKRHELIIIEHNYWYGMANKGREYANSKFSPITKKSSNKLKSIKSVIMKLASFDGTITGLMKLYAFGKQIFYFVINLFK